MKQIREGFYDVYKTIAINPILEGLEFVITYGISNKSQKIRASGCSISDRVRMNYHANDQMNYWRVLRRMRRP
ncbi:hypothetical protein BDFB_004638 [Asbolus verrucosus]|uniref:Uncharacterized protein n=1 Tax=Asbolus verrucosus TaxID=1661398 RepID=A0A482V9J8_ASBVE|nr:hypothetical protein BDFB_004638 [Asbolus verrucosus]